MSEPSYKELLEQLTKVAENSVGRVYAEEASNQMRRGGIFNPTEEGHDEKVLCLNPSKNSEQISGHQPFAQQLLHTSQEKNFEIDSLSSASLRLVSLIARQQQFVLISLGLSLVQLSLFAHHLTLNSPFSWLFAPSQSDRTIGEGSGGGNPSANAEGGAA